MKNLIFVFVFIFGMIPLLSAKLRVHRIDKLGAGSSSSPRFDHQEARAEAKKVFAELAVKHDWEFTQSSGSEIFNDKGLKGIDVLIFDNNSGLLFDDSEKKALERWVQKGGGVIGIHGASHAHKGVDQNNEAEWPFWYGMWGVLHKTGPKEGPQGRRGYADWVVMTDVAGRWTRNLPKRWRFDKVEWYFWNYHQSFGEAQVIATAEVKQNQPGLPEHYPITWSHEYQGGRVWYTNMGHYAENFRQKEFVQHLLDGIEWVSGMRNP
jgi:type 1 glutamine amidotransferase